MIGSNMLVCSMNPPACSIVLPSHHVLLFVDATVQNNTTATATAILSDAESIMDITTIEQ